MGSACRLVLQQHAVRMLVLDTQGNGCGSLVCSAWRYFQWRCVWLSEGAGSDLATFAMFGHAPADVSAVSLQALESQMVKADRAALRGISVGGRNSHRILTSG